MENNKLFSTLHIKSFDEDKREISGMASTPTPDRSLDIVVPEGAIFKAEIPFIWQHNHTKPIGIAKLGKPTKGGIPFTATIAKIDEDGELQKFLDMAWQSIKYQLVRGVSIGFRALEYNYLENGGVKFEKYEIYELSAVTIPANEEATITNIKHYAGFKPKAERPIFLTKTKPLPFGAVKLANP